MNSDPKKSEENQTASDYNDNDINYHYHNDVDHKGEAHESYRNYKLQTFFQAHHIE